MKQVKKIISTIMTIAICFSMPLSVMAKDSTGSDYENERARLGVWVEYNDKTQTYETKKGASNALTKEEYSKLVECLERTNNDMRVLKKENIEMHIVKPGDENASAQNQAQICKFKFKNGKTKVDFYWWGVRVYISKADVRTYGGAGITIGSTWIPDKSIAKIVATLGVAVTNCPGGIRFDVNCLSFIMNSGNKDIVQNILDNISNVRFQ